MTRDQALTQLREYCHDVGDTDGNHRRADKILCDLLVSLGFEDVVEKYKEINKWYS